MKNLLKNKKVILLVVITLGLIVRLLLAYSFFGSGDVCAWERFSTYWE